MVPGSAGTGGGLLAANEFPVICKSQRTATTNVSAGAFLRRRIPVFVVTACLMSMCSFLFRACPERFEPDASQDAFTRPKYCLKATLLSKSDIFGAFGAE